MENQQSDRFLSKMAWNNTQKQELNINMMPPRTTLVPVSQRRSSTLIDSHSPPMRSLKTELMDENSQSSIMDHMMNENSVDSMRHRFRPINENSQDIINENSSENSNFHCEKSNESTSRSPRDRMLGVTNLVQPEIPAPLKGVDLRLKGPITTISDLADTQPPSMATLLKFGVTEPTNMPLPAQTGQSVENFFLTTLENPNIKPILSNSLVKNNTKANENKVQQALNHLASVQGTKLFNEQVMNNNNNPVINETIINGEILPLNESHIVNNGHIVFPNNIKPSQAEVLKNEHLINQLNNNLLPVTTQTEVMKTENLILTEQSLQVLSTNLLTSTKSDPSLLLSQPIQNEQILTQQLNNTLLSTSTQNESLKTDTSLILTQQSLVVNLLPTATPKLDELVNSTVESHIGSPQEILPNPTEILHSPEIIITNTHPDVLLNTQAPLLSSTLSPGNDLLIRSPQADISHQDIILNPQVSPSVICPDTLLGSNLKVICQPTGLESCLQTNECLPENNIIQSHMIKTPKIGSDITAPILNMFESNGPNGMIIKGLLIHQNVLDKPEGETVKRIPEQRQGCPDLITPGITDMSENDLIHYINPHCFEGTYTS